MMPKPSRLLLTAAFALSMAVPALPVLGQTSASTDKPAHTYRLLYTVTESDAGKRLGVQHFAMTVVSGQRASMKEGSKIPVVTGGYTQAGTPQQGQYQITYIDVGLNLDATLSDGNDGLQLKATVEQSGMLDPVDSITKDPVIRQSRLDNSCLLKVGTPVVLGSLDVPGSTRHLDIEVVAERVP